MPVFPTADPLFKRDVASGVKSVLIKQQQGEQTRYPAIAIGKRMNTQKIKAVLLFVDPLEKLILLHDAFPRLEDIMLCLNIINASNLPALA
ncbi:MAG: hypothetical protein LBI42_03545 [Chitinispirillales bacterium]|jgi:hypothetical protein|nr:hypothetical protein [Chitinispirillales bacterium]